MSHSFGVGGSHRAWSWFYLGMQIGDDRCKGEVKKQWEWGIRGWNVCFSGDKQARKREIVLGAGLSGFFLLWGYLEEAKAATKEVE